MAGRKRSCSFALLFFGKYWLYSASIVLYNVAVYCLIPLRYMTTNSDRNSDGFKVQQRKVQLASVKEGSRLSLAHLESHHPSGAKVHLDADSVLHWPVLFLYPEYGETDFIQAFKETDIFDLHLNYMFGGQMDPPGWDEDRKYCPQNITIYFEEKEKQILHLVQKTDSLKLVLSNPGYVVQGGMPSFILLVKESEFAKSFLSKYMYS